MESELENEPSEPECVVTNVGAIRIVRMNRPRRSNSLNLSLWHTLVDEVLSASEEDSVRAVILTGTGKRAFCGGADLVEIRERDLAGIPFRAPTAMPVRQPFEVLMECYKPTIAALNGSAVAGGLELALACDIRIAAAGIFIGAPEAKVGMGANFASVVLPRRIPVGVAMEMLFTGDYITSEDALKWGLVNRVVEQERVMDESINLAERMLANSPISIRAMKERAMKGLEMPVPAALRLNVGPNPYLSDDRKEGIAARNEGRTPVWPNR